MDEVIYSASCPFSYVASIVEVIYSTHRPEISHSASSPPAKKLEYLSFSDKNTYLFCCIVALLHCCFSTRLLTFPTALPCSFACAGRRRGFEMDKDSSTKLIASLHETHLKRT
jgi:hypothetical protein